MKPEHRSQTLLAITRSKAKMVEYAVPDKHHIELPQDPANLFTLSIGILGDVVALSGRPGATAEKLNALRETLNFSAYFFDAYLQSKLNSELNPYVILLGSAAYYLCDLPGAAKVLAKQLGENCPDLGAGGLEGLLLWLLQGDVSFHWETYPGLFEQYVVSISKAVSEFFLHGSEENVFFDLCTGLRNLAYDTGSPRQLLLADVIGAVARKKYENSSWHSIPNYSGVARQQWLQAFQKESFIKELWPAQHLLGHHGVLRGQSAIVQMPTSAGKTKATELIIRSAFLSNRTSLTIIVAPFRALCHEIKNSLLSSFQGEAINVDALSDVLQTDFDLADLLGGKQIIVVTPEKLVYVMRHAPQLATKVGLIIFDEGHQFDSGIRGITYELLVTSLRLMLPPESQKILISAVISNAQALGEWLNGKGSAVVAGTNLLPTLRSVGFASWLAQRGQIQFVASANPEKQEFFVPRVLEQSKLNAKPRERKERFFPDKSDGTSIALFLGLKLVPNGSVAIFCGKKQTAASVCEMSVDIFERGLALNSPAQIADPSELTSLHYLHEQNLGSDASATKAALLGIFSHHGNTPHGIRLAVEHAMREGLIHFVVCTSTLAQGVNLPIRYLLVTSVYQGQEPIMVRDFHNLIGRAGRAGMHTEGSVLFADPIVYDKRKVWNEKWRWEQMKTLLEPSNSEPCISTLLSIFEPITNDRKTDKLPMQALDFARAYVNSPNEISTLARRIARSNPGYSQANVQEQISYKVLLISAIESFLMSNWDVKDDDSEVVALAEATLAYFLADGKTKKLIKELFALLSTNIAQEIDNAKRRQVFGRTLYGLRDVQEIESWVAGNLDALAACDSPNELFALVWPLLSKHVKNKNFQNCDNPAALLKLASSWIGGDPYHELFSQIRKSKVKRNWGQKKREFTLDDIVDICENGLAYDGALLIGAVSELAEFVQEEPNDDLKNNLHILQKLVKYGLPNQASSVLYELGFSDRVIALDLAENLALDEENKRQVKRSINRHRKMVSDILEKYPTFFAERLNEID